MRLRFFLSIAILLMPSFVFAQSAKEVYKSLKKLDLQTERAISYKEYKVGASGVSDKVISQRENTTL